MMTIRKGYRRPWTATPDEPLDGAIRAEAIEGDSTVTINPDGLSGWLNGDGGISHNEVDFVADGHVGPGEVEIRFRVAWDVVHPDATNLGFLVGDEELIPPPPA